MKNINEISSVKDVKNYVQNLCSLPLAVQLKHSRQIIAKPLDYAKPVTHEGIILDNADLIAEYLKEYEEAAKNCPESILDVIKVRLADEILDMVERNQ